MEKLDKAVVLYFPARLIGSPSGAKCAGCWKYVANSDDMTRGKCLEVEGTINGPQGVCALYVKGHSDDSRPKVVQITKQVAGYTEDGPTHCGSCEYYGGADSANGPCARVQGIVEFDGCCNAWEAR